MDETLTTWMKRELYNHPKSIQGFGVISSLQGTEQQSKLNDITKKQTSMCHTLQYNKVQI